MSNLPSFDRAGYALTPSSTTTDHCTQCQQPVAGSSYCRINGNLICESCALEAIATPPSAAPCSWASQQPSSA